MQHRSRRWLAVGLVAALVAAGCGGDDDDADAPDSTTDVTEPATTEPATTEPETTEPETTEPATTEPETTEPETTEPETTEPETTEPETTEPATGDQGSIDAEQRADAIELTDDELAALEGLAPGQLVGIVAATMATDYHKSLNESVQARAEELGFDAEIFDSREDPNQQLQGIEGFISKGAAAIIVTGLGGETIGPVAAEAAEQGIFVVQVAGRDLADIGAVTISVEEEDIATAAGTAAGEYAAEVYGEEPIEMVITDYPSIESLVARADTIEASFTEVYPYAEFVPRILGGTAENGVTSMETALQAHPDIVGVLGINDAGNLGAHQALLNAGKTGDDVFIFGIDCEAQAVELIEEGGMYKGCVNTNPVGTGVLAVDVFAQWLAGGTVPGILEVPVFVQTAEG
jgi:ABC-type sugar transport system substrate-binding protein